MTTQIVGNLELFSEAQLEALEFVPEELESLESELYPNLDSISLEEVAKDLEAYFEGDVKVVRLEGRARLNIQKILTHCACGKLRFPPKGRARLNIQEILTAHNKYRSEVGVRPLKWSDKLAKSAQQWANHLAATGKFAHSKGGPGENLWMGSTGRFSPTNMVDSWGKEKKFFVNRPSPNMSTSGKFGDVGHYTQMVWRNTTEVGCALVSGRGKDYLVCHYSPAGNVSGQKAF